MRNTYVKQKQSLLENPVFSSFFNSSGQVPEKEYIMKTFMKLFAAFALALVGVSAMADAVCTEGEFIHGTTWIPKETGGPGYMVETVKAGSITIGGKTTDIFEPRIGARCSTRSQAVGKVAVVSEQGHQRAALARARGFKFD